MKTTVICGLFIFSFAMMSCKKTPPAPVASFFISGSTFVPATLTLTNTSQNADSYLWDFGDGRTTNIANPMVTYDRHGQYTITLTATQTATGKKSVATQVVSIVMPSPISDFSISGSTVTPATLNLINHSQNADRFFWDFGNGNTSTVNNPTVTYDSAGLYTITLTALQTITGETKVTSKTVRITPGRVYLSSVTFHQLPLKTGRGEDWDVMSGPDVFFCVELNHQRVQASSVIHDVYPDKMPLNLSLGNGCLISEWDQEYEIKVLDYDEFTRSDYLCSVFFKINEINEINNYPSKIRVQTKMADATLHFKWK